MCKSQEICFYVSFVLLDMLLRRVTVCCEASLWLYFILEHKIYIFKVIYECCYVGYVVFMYYKLCILTVEGIQNYHL